jgi:hypothetical protein
MARLLRGSNVCTGFKSYFLCPPLAKASPIHWSCKFWCNKRAWEFIEGIGRIGHAVAICYIWAWQPFANLFPVTSFKHKVHVSKTNSDKFKTKIALVQQVSINQINSSFPQILVFCLYNFHPNTQSSLPHPINYGKKPVHWQSTGHPSHTLNTAIPHTPSTQQIK